MNTRFAKGFWQLIAGGLCIASGIVTIFLGWYGAAHTRDLTEQIPYLISGGIFGLALVVLGSAFYFSHFVADAARATRRQQKALESMRSPEASALSQSHVITVPGGTTYHRPGCPLASGKEGSSHDPAEVAGLGYEPCNVCEPAA